MMCGRMERKSAEGGGGKDSLPAARFALAGPLPLIKGDSFIFEGGSRKERKGRERRVF